jgi:hypothetical protein
LILISKPGKSAGKGAFIPRRDPGGSLFLPQGHNPGQICAMSPQLLAPQNNPFSPTQPDAGGLASLSPARPKSKGKTHHFIIYLICGLFDTLENRVITSELTLASISEAFWVSNQVRRSLKPSQKWRLLKSPGKSVWNFVLALKENDG